MSEEPEPVRIPVEGELDLHTFRPQEIPSLIEHYLAACEERGLREVRIIHGKGTGALRETVHALLRRSPAVASYRLGDETTGGWGATLATLRKTRGRNLSVPASDRVLRTDRPVT